MKKTKYQIQAILALMIINILYCSSQTNYTKPCNRNVVDKTFLKNIPENICIPDGYTIGMVKSDVDLNGDSLADLVVRYEKHPCNDGDLTYYNIYFQDNKNTFKLKTTLSNIDALFVKSYSSTYLSKNPKADTIAKKYPGSIEIVFETQQIKISHRIPDVYGRTLAFIYNKSRDNWYLEKITYWIGKVPSWMINNYNLSESLYNKVYLKEEKIPAKKISIDEFDLKKSKEEATEESTYLTNKYDILDWEKK